MMHPSPYVTDILGWVDHGQGSLVVEAVAGSGKTTVLAQICRRIPRQQSVRVFMFNRPVSETFKSRVALPNVLISTYNSAGYQALLKHVGAKVETERHKMSGLLREHLEYDDYRAYGDPLKELLGLAKGHGVGALAPAGLMDELIDTHDLDFDWLIPPRLPAAQLEAHMTKERQRVLQLARDLLLISNEAAAQPFEWRMDFDDQLYLPILWNLPLQQYDWVLVDELQDTNAIQREMLKRSLKPGGRYAWRGASANAMDLVREDFQAAEKPLSVCYRCAHTIIAKAKQLVPQIEAAPDAPAGTLYEGAPLDRLATLGPGDAILCRNNAPLVKTAYQLLAKGVGCQILGRDIGEGLIKLIEKLRPTTVEMLETQLAVYKDKEAKRFRKQQQESKAQGVEDRVQCITTIIEALRPEDRTVSTVIAAIQGLFGEGDKPLLTLSTVHKAKGQEWPVVAILRSDLMPSFWATKDWQIQQEANLQYVAWTRAQHTLLIMDDKPEWLKKKEQRERGATV
jgi:superfamily I DNA/RNA helicase